MLDNLSVGLSQGSARIGEGIRSLMVDYDRRREIVVCRIRLDKSNINKSSTKG